MAVETDRSGIRISWTVLFAIIGAIISMAAAYGTGVWFVADLTDNVKKQADAQIVFDKRLSDISSSYDRRLTELGSSIDRRVSADEDKTEHRFNVDEDKTGMNKDQIQSTTNAINDRLIRIEAQLAYLVKTTQPSR